jgi:hypothetical protein
MHRLSRLGRPGERGFASGHNAFEKCGNKLKTLDLLVLEFGDKCENLLSVNQSGNGGNSTISNEHPFALTVAYPKKWQERMRLAYEKDWMPNEMFSKSRRHYLVGDLSEMLELSNFLISASSHVGNMLRLPLGDKFSSARKIFNSLLGDISVLGLDSTPSDTFTNVLNEDESASASYVGALKSLCIDAIVGVSTLREDKQQSRQFETEDDVHDFLCRCGITYDLDKVNMCLKAALLNGKMRVPDDMLHTEDASSWLDQVLLSEECRDCICNFSLVSLASSARQSSQYTREENTLAPAIAIVTENRTKKYEQMQ